MEVIPKLEDGVLVDESQQPIPKFEDGVVVGPVRELNPERAYSSAQYFADNPESRGPDAEIQNHAMLSLLVGQDPETSKPEDVRALAFGDKNNGLEYSIKKLPEMIDAKYAVSPEKKKAAKESREFFALSADDQTAQLQKKQDDAPGLKTILKMYLRDIKDSMGWGEEPSDTVEQDWTLPITEKYLNAHKFDLLQKDSPSAIAYYSQELTVPQRDFALRLAMAPDAKSRESMVGDLWAEASVGLRRDDPQIARNAANIAALAGAYVPDIDFGGVLSSGTRKAWAMAKQIPEQVGEMASDQFMQLSDKISYDKAFWMVGASGNTPEGKPVFDDKHQVTPEGMDYLFPKVKEALTRISYGDDQTLASGDMKDVSVKLPSDDEVRAFIKDKMYSLSEVGAQTVDKGRALRMIRGLANPQELKSGNAFKDDLSDAVAMLEVFTPMALTMAGAARISPVGAVALGSYLFGANGYSDIKGSIIDAGGDPQAAVGMATVAAPLYGAAEYYAAQALLPGISKLEAGAFAYIAKNLPSAFLNMAKIRAIQTASEYSEEVAQSAIVASARVLAYEYFDAKGVSPEQIGGEFMQQITDVLPVIAMAQLSPLAVDAAGVSTIVMMQKNEFGSRSIRPVADILKMARKRDDALSQTGADSAISAPTIRAMQKAETTEARRKILVDSGFKGDVDSALTMAEKAIELAAGRDGAAEEAAAQIKANLDAARREQNELPVRLDVDGVARPTPVDRTVLDSAHNALPADTRPNLKIFNTTGEAMTPDADGKVWWTASDEKAGARSKVLPDGTVVMVLDNYANTDDALSDWIHEVLSHSATDYSAGGRKGADNLFTVLFDLSGEDYVRGVLGGLYDRYAKLYAGDNVKAGLMSEAMANITTKMTNKQTLTPVEESFWDKVYYYFAKRIGVLTKNDVIDRALRQEVRSIVKEFKAGGRVENQSATATEPSSSLSEKQRRQREAFSRNQQPVDKALADFIDQYPKIRNPKPDDKLHEEIKGKSYKEQGPVPWRRFTSDESAPTWDEILDMAAKDIPHIIGPDDYGDPGNLAKIYRAKRETVGQAKAKENKEWDSRASEEMRRQYLEESDSGVDPQTEKEGQLIADLESGKITRDEFDAAMNELSGARFSIFGEWASPVSTINGKQMLIGFRGESQKGVDNLGDIAGTEGIGLYVSKDRSTAEFFNNGGSKIREVRFPMPSNPLLVENEAMPILHETEDMIHPIADGDSVWIKLNKQAAKNVGLTDENWGEKTDSGELQRELTNLVRASGYDAVVVKTGGEEWAVLIPEKEGDRVRFSIQPDSLGFYSPLEKAIDGFKQDTFTVDQLRGMINGAPGVKQEELDDLGFMDWLDGLSGKVTKEQALEFIRNGGPQIREVVKGVGAKFSADEDGMSSFIEEVSGDESLWNSMQREFNDGLRMNDTESRVPDFNSFSTAEDRMEYFIDHPDAADDYVRTFQQDVEGVGGTKFSQYQEPGGENYREVLLTLPGRVLTKDEKLELTTLAQQTMRSKVGNGPALSDDQDARYEELAKIESDSEKNQFLSQHWDEPNVLAHVRLNDRTGSNGEKILFVEEIQSDWHQAGRKKGYRDPKKLAETRKRIDAGETVAGYTDASSAPQNAPFKKSWAMLAFKRVLRMAAEQGYDSVAWTPGEVQADRYDLSKQVDSVTWYNPITRFGSDKATGVRDVIIELPNHPNVTLALDAEGTVLVGTHLEFKGKNITDIIGKDIGEKIIQSERGSLKGDGLKVGGEGMKGFYDQILPKEIQKYVGKMGGKVGQLDIAIGENAAFMDGDNATVWSLPITDAMRDSVMQGQPRFSLATGEKSPMLIGIVGRDGVVKVLPDTQRGKYHADLWFDDFRRGADRFRYNHGRIVWTDTPSDESRVAVENMLSRAGLPVGQDQRFSVTSENPEPADKYSLSQQRDPDRRSVIHLVLEKAEGRTLNRALASSVLKHYGSTLAPANALFKAHRIYRAIEPKLKEGLADSREKIISLAGSAEISQHYLDAFESAAFEIYVGGSHDAKITADAEARRSADAEKAGVKASSVVANDPALKLSDLVEQLDVEEKKREPPKKTSSAAEKEEDRAAKDMGDVDFDAPPVDRQSLSAYIASVKEASRQAVGDNSAAYLGAYRNAASKLLRQAAKTLTQGRNRETITKASVDIRDVLTEASIDRRFINGLDKAFQFRVRGTIDLKIDDLNKALSSLPKRGKETGAWHQDRMNKAKAEYFRKVKAALKLSPEKTAERLEELDAEIENKAEFEQNNPNNTGAVEKHIALLHDREIVESFGGLKYKSLAEVADIVDKTIADIDAQLAAQQKLVEAFKEKSDKLSGLIMQGANNAISAPSSKIGKARLQSVSQMSPLFSRLEVFTSFFPKSVRDILWNDDPRIRSFKQISRDISAAAASIKAQDKADMDNLIGMIKAAYGIKSTMAAEKKLAELERGVDAYQRFSKANVKNSMSKGDLMQLFAFLEQPEQYGDNAELHGRAEDYAEIKKELSKDSGDLKMIELLRADYAKDRPALSKKLMEVTGLPIPNQEDSYLPVKMNHVSGMVTVASALQMTPSTLSRRRKNKLDVDETRSIFEIYQDRKHKNAVFMNMAELAMEVQSVFTRQDVGAAIQSTFGKDFYEGIKNAFMDSLTQRPNWSNSTSGERFLMNFGGVILSFSPGPALKQGTSLLSVSYDYKIGQTLKTLFAAPFSDEGRSFMVEMFKSEQAKTRYGSGASYELARAFESGHPGVGAVRYIMSKYGLAPNKAIDYITSAYGGTMVYMAEYQALVRMGIDEASAKKEAMNRAWDVIERTQQSSMVQNQPAWLRGGGAMNKLVGMFTTQPQLMLAAERSALLVARNTNTSEAWTRAARILVLNHLILPSLFKFVDHLWKAALGREPDDEEWIEWVAFCLAGPFSGWFVWGRLVDSAVPAFIRAASGNGANYFDDPTLIPAEAMFKNIGNLVKSAGNLVAGDTEEAARYLDAAAKQGIPAYRVAKELWENYGE